MGSNGEDAVTAVRGADGCRWDAVPFDIEPERGQRSEYFSPDGSVVESKEVRHVLHEDVDRSKLANGSGHLAPQNGLGVLEPVALAGGRGALAREPTGDEVDGLDGAGSDGANVVASNSARESPGEDDVASPVVPLADPCGFGEAGQDEAVVEEPDAGEEAAMAHTPPSRFALEVAAAARCRRRR